MLLKFRLLTVFLFFLQTTVCIAQQTLIRSGVITLAESKMVGFKNLTLTKERVSFTNVSTNEWFSYPLSEVIKVEDDKQQVIVYGTAPKPQPTTVVEAVRDTLYRPGYPDGIYKSKEDFINKKPATTPYLVPKGLVGLEKPTLETIEDACFFYDINNEKVKKAFAISYKGCLYFRIGAILENRNKTDRAQDSHFTNGFVRVLIGGENYFYTEADLANIWAQGVAYGVGGVGGGVLAASNIKGKGIVWDFKNSEFNIFKNCKDYNLFIKSVYPEGVQNCDGQQPDMYEVRVAMEKIK